MFFKNFIKKSEIKDKNIFNKFYQFVFYILISALLTFIISLAAPPISPHQPGETLNPNCSPGDPNCTVYPPIFSTSTLQPGSILFSISTSTVDQDNANLFWDIINKRLGIGTNTPVANLTVIGNSLIGKKIYHPGGFVIQENPSSDDDEIISIAADDSYVYLAGYDSSPGLGNPQWRIEKRDKTTGALVSSFGSGGVITENPSSGFDEIYSITIDDSYLYLAGIDESPGDPQWRIEKRDKTTGALVSSFGSGGVITENISSGNDRIWSIAIDDSYLYVGGSNFSPGFPFGNSQWRIEKRDKTTGALVSSFGSGGVITEDPSGGDDWLISITIDDSYLYLGGYDSSPGNAQWRIEKIHKDTGSTSTPDYTYTSSKFLGDNILPRYLTSQSHPNPWAITTTSIYYTVGSVGIGTTTPNSLLELFQSSNPVILTLTANNNDSYIAFRNNTTTQALIGIDTSDANKLKIVRGSDIATSTGITITQTGNVGIGTTNPTNILTIVQNSVTDPIADAWTVYSTPDSKIILGTADNETEKYLETFKNLPVYTWKRNEKEQVRLGAVAVTSTPPEILAYDAEGKIQGIDLGAYIGFIHEVVKGIVKKLDGIQKIIDALGVYVENGVAKVKELIADKITAKKARLDKIEMVDQATGEIYCVWLQFGEWVKVRGKCDEVGNNQVLSSSGGVSSSNNSSSSSTDNNTSNNNNSSNNTEENNSANVNNQGESDNNSNSNSSQTSGSEENSSESNSSSSNSNSSSSGDSGSSGETNSSSSDSSGESLNSSNSSGVSDSSDSYDNGSSQ